MSDIALQEVMAGFTNRQVDGMLKIIARQLDIRRAFELLQRPSVPTVELNEADKQMRGNKTLARFLLANSVDVSDLLNRSRKAGYRSALKGIRKLRKLSEYSINVGSIDRVSKALFAATIIAGIRGTDWISNSEQKLVLSNLPLSTIEDTELREAIAHWQNKFMRLNNESMNQSCQWRCTFENCNAYTVSARDTVNGQELGVTVNPESPIIKELTKRWGLDKYK